ncbi:MAG: DUF502 domain-containing protein [Candidatus Eisenbacteria bacterium]
MIRKLRNYFAAGLLVILPILVTVWFLFKMFVSVDGYLGPLFVRYTGRSIPGLGFAATVFLILFVGLFASNLIGRKLIGTGERIVHRIPIVSKLYLGVKQISAVIFREQEKFFRDVVAVEYPRKGIWAVAFLTNRMPSVVPGAESAEMMAVFLPTTPNPTSGFLLLVPRDQMHPLPMSVEEGVKFVISGGAVVPDEWIERLRASAEVESMEEARTGGSDG